MDRCLGCWDSQWSWPAAPSGFVASTLCLQSEMHWSSSFCCKRWARGKGWVANAESPCHFASWRDSSESYMWWIHFHIDRGPLKSSKQRPVWRHRSRTHTKARRGKWNIALIYRRFKFANKARTWLTKHSINLPRPWSSILVWKISQRNQNRNQMFFDTVMPNEPELSELRRNKGHDDDNRPECFPAAVFLHVPVLHRFRLHLLRSSHVSHGPTGETPHCLWSVDASFFFVARAHTCTHTKTRLYSLSLLTIWPGSLAFLVHMVNKQFITSLFFSLSCVCARKHANE